MVTYISQQKNQLLDSLENQVRFSQLVAVIVGEKGIGKSLVLKQLQERLNQEVQVATIDASLAMTVDQLDKSIRLQLGLSWQNAEISLEQKINNDLTQKVLITVDDACLLSSDCLEFMLKLNQNQLNFQESVLFVLLAGDNTLPNIISNTECYAQHQEMCVVFEIEPIQKNETQLLIEAFGDSNNEVVDGLFEEKQLNYFWQLSKGNPAELNYHLSRWLGENAPSKIVEVSHKEQASYLRSAFYGFIVVGFLALLFFQDAINRWISTGQPTNLQEKPVVQPVDNKPETLTTEQNSVAKKKITTQVVEVSKTGTINARTILDPPDEKPLAKENNPIEKIVKDDDEGEVSPKVKTDNNLEPKSDSIKSIIKPSNKVIVPHKNVSGVSLTQAEQGLLDKNSDFFALQWVGVSRLEAAQQYKLNHPLSTSISIYRRASGSKTLFLVVSGHFSTRAQANLAKNDYQQRGFVGKPWVKSIASIQSEIKAFQSK